MDLGQFRRSRTAFWGWIVMPLVLVAVVYYLLHVYCTSVETGLQRRRAVLGILPDLQRRVTLASDVVRGFAMVGGGQAADMLSSQINDTARRFGFIINSLRIDKVEPKPAAGKKNKPAAALPPRTSRASQFTIDIAGEGDLLALIRFLGQLQRPQSLMRAEKATLRLSRLQAEPVYDVELTLRCQVMQP